MTQRHTMTPWDLAHLDLDSWDALSLDLRVPLAAVPFLGWRYCRRSPRVPYSPCDAYPGAIVDASARLTNCSTMTSAVVMALYPRAAWAAEHYRMLQVYRGQPYDAPTRAVVDVGVGRRVDALRPECWHLAQLYTAPPSGHAVLLRAAAEGADQAWMLHASSRDERGPTIDRVSLRALRERYPIVHLAALGHRPR